MGGLKVKMWPINAYTVVLLQYQKEEEKKNKAHMGGIGQQ